MDKKVAFGFILTLMIVAFVPIYWIGEPSRQAAAAERQQHESAELGAHTYIQLCTQCHGQSGEGLIGPALRDTALDAEALEKAIARGIPNTAMPAWADDDGGPLSKHQITNLVTFIVNWDDSMLESGE